jgi:adenylate cyclase
VGKQRTGVTGVASVEARRNEELVLAEAALIGERRVAQVRLAMFVVFMLSQEVIGPLFGQRLGFDGIKMFGIGIYLAFAITTFLVLRRQRPDPHRAMVAPIVVTFIDFGFVAFLGMRDYVRNGQIHAEMGASAFALLISLSLTRYSWIHIALSTTLACTSYLTLGGYAGILTPLATTFVIGGFLGLGGMLILTNRHLHRMFSDLRRRDNLSRFLPRPIVERVLSLGGMALAPVQREVTVVFTDIRDFTSYAEALQPREVLEFLDEYFGHMAQVVKGHDGIVNKFLGDGMLAFWGVPDKNAEHAACALRCALDMRTVLAELNQVRAGRGDRPLRIGVGVHSGPVAAGMLGGAEQHEYTVIGDAVNVASRIEGLTKTLDVDILVSERTWRLAEGRFRGERLPEQKIKGRSEPVVVYRLDDVEPAASASVA